MIARILNKAVADVASRNPFISNGTEQRIANVGSPAEDPGDTTNTMPIVAALFQRGIVSTQSCNRCLINGQRFIKIRNSRVEIPEQPVLQTINPPMDDEFLASLPCVARD